MNRISKMLLVTEACLAIACGRQTFDRRSKVLAEDPQAEDAVRVGDEVKQDLSEVKDDKAQKQAYELGKKLYASNCASCHGPLAASTKRNATAPEVSKAILDVGAMSFLRDLTDEQIQSVALALSDEAKEAFDDDPAGSLDGIQPGARSLPMATRGFVMSQLTSVFSAAGSPIDLGIIDRLVKKQPAAFGGSCRPYDGTCKTSNQPDRLGYQEALMTPSPSPVRAGLRVQVCEKILEQNVYVTNALGNAGVIAAADVSPATVAKVYGLFVPGHPLAPDANEALVRIGKKAADVSLPKVDHWRYVMLSICTSAAFDMF